MIPAVSGVRMSGAAGGGDDLPLLVLGPSLGTSARALWTDCVHHLSEDFDVLAWDLPGHGDNRAVPDGGFTMAELAQGVAQLVADVQEQRSDAGAPYAYAGVSVGGCVGLQLLLDHRDQVSAAALICTGARIGDEHTWTDRVARVRASGTAGLVSASAERWFAPGFVEASPSVSGALLHALSDAADIGYVAVCDALRDFDVRDRLGSITTPVLAIAGDYDPVCPPESLGQLAEGVRNGRLAVLADTGHLAPAERPEEVADLLREHCGQNGYGAISERTVTH